MPHSMLHEIASTYGDDGANRTSIRCPAFEIDDEEVLTISTIVPQHRRRAVQVVDNDVEIAVVIEIDSGGPPADGARGQRRA